ncbi:MAG: MFS transporter, partial [Thaumarchaeota archaeon]|nr:MFS transporter [Nitrososphaerota archaeon]
MFSYRLTALSYALRASPVYIAVFLMRFSFAFTVVALQYIVPVPYQRGIIASAYPLLEMITGLFFGILADKIGRKWIIVGALLLSSLVSFSFTLTKSFPLLVLIHGLQGICAAAIITSTLASLADIAKPQTRGREMGLYDFCTIGGYGMGFVVSLLLIEGSASRAYLPFYVGAAVAIVGGTISGIFLKDVRIGSSSGFSITANVKKILVNKKALTLAATWFVFTILIGAGL